MAPMVSVILPAFNRIASLGAACRSVLDQSVRDLELILVDDASTEDVAGIAREIDDPRLIYVRRDVNGGVSAARNTGLSRAAGAYFAFQDSDDLWLPGKLNRQLELLQSLPTEVGAVTGGKILYGRDAQRRYGPGKVTYAPAAGHWLNINEDQARRFLCENRISLQNTLFRRDCYPELKWFDELAKANADWEFAVRLVQHTKVYEDPQPVVVSFISQDSISTSSRKKTLGLIRILKKNKIRFDLNKNEYGIFSLKLGVSLYNAKRKRLARYFVMKSILLRPRNAISVFVSVLNSLNKARTS